MVEIGGNQHMLGFTFCYVFKGKRSANPSSNS
jgi:hypothetical protein